MTTNRCFAGMALATLLLMSAGGASAQNPSPCTATAETRVVRLGGLTELVADILLECLNPSMNSFGTEAVLIMEAGQGAAITPGLQDPVIILNEAQPEDQVLGEFQEVNPDDANVFVGRVAEFGANAITFGRIPIAPDAEGVFATRITNVRVDTTTGVAVALVTGPGQSTRIPVQFTSSNQGGAPFIPAGPQILAEIDPQPFTFAAETPPLPSSAGVVAQSSAPLTVTFSETFPGAARKRIETTGGPEPTGTPAAQNIPGMNYNTESGFTLPGADPTSPGAVGVADSGTRFIVEFRPTPADITYQAPKCVAAQGTLGMELRQVTGFAADFSGGTLASTCETTPVSPREGPVTLVYEVVGDSGVHGGETVDSYAIAFGASCAGSAALSEGGGAAQPFGTMLVLGGIGPVQLEGIAVSAGKAQGAPFAYPRFEDDRFQRGINLNAVCAAAGGKPSFTPEGFTDAAAFGTPPSAGALASLFGDFGVGLAQATEIPLPEELGGVTVTFENAPGAASNQKAQSLALNAPLLFVSAGQINLQIPWEVDISSGEVTAVVTVDGVSSDPVALPVAALSPGIFTFESGPGHAVAVNPDGTVAQPDGAVAGVASRPVQIGEALVIYATGLGITSPPAVTADDSLDDQGAFVRRDTVELPRVTIGGVEQQLVFSGMSPQFVGVNQINVVVVAGTPAGDEQPLVLEAGGLSSRSDVTVAVAAN